MPDYIAFLRAINLGATRKFPKADIAAATEAAGGRDVETYINTGNVRLTTSLRSPARVRDALEQAYLADRGFEVPTLVFTPREVRELTERGLELRDGSGPGARHYVTLFHAPPDPAAIANLLAIDVEGERVVVEGRAAYTLIDGDIHTSRLLAAKEYAALGEGTARTITVLRTITEKWC
ncbi:DUF1697 domain-containing protein [Nostocoides sp. F2B08]|uniref:DUF1697 domain-containing protein n=1 Tax=Nostocoides sp. F2B08 TaxID=2653936 RepID=UPI001262F58C|nr:DUF1697 domain-containing protein [Tetrasphaera sp. F2B08]KAB7745340.1 DUF1697 domain-containing protein [Tetrasphaera sp. F2B08]